MPLEYCVVNFLPKSVSDVCAMRQTSIESIENIVASEYVKVDLTEVVIPQAERRVVVPGARERN